MSFLVVFIVGALMKLKKLSVSFTVYWFIFFILERPGKVSCVSPLFAIITIFHHHHIYKARREYIVASLSSI